MNGINKGVFLLLALLLSSCVAENPPTKESVPAPITESKYEKCEEEFYLLNVINTIDTFPLGDNYIVAEKELEVPISDNMNAFIEKSDYIFLNRAAVSVQNGRLDFVRWFKIYVDNTSEPMLVWGKSIKGKESHLEVDGSVDLMKYAGGDNIDIHVRAELKSPPRDIEAIIHLELLGFQGCEE